jgi:spoIIIJ-associated protein
VKKVRISGATIAEALEKAKQEFGLRDEEFDYVVVEKGSKGFFGIMAKEAVVEVSFKKEFYERRLEQFMVGILRSYGKIKVKVSSAGKRFLVLLEGDDLGRLIGKHGKTLAALQHIAMIYLNRLSDTKLSVVVDAGEYREKRKRNLEQIVLQAIDRARVEKKRIVLDPMFAFERRLVHEIVKKYRDVKSYSVGVEPYRKVVIEYSPNGKEVHTT